jgi:glycosyltransferase involved in cell wall biosynthesis
MKIVFLCSEYPPRPHGGIGTFVQTLARTLQKRGHTVTVVGLGQEEKESADGAIRVITLRQSNIRFVGNLISRLRLRRWLASLARAGQVDIIETPDYGGLVPLGVPQTPVVVRLHLTTTSIYKHAGWKVPLGVSLYERRTLAANPNWIGVSQHILDATKQLFQILPEHSAVIYNPVPPLPSDSPEVPGLPTNFVLYAGQVSRRKGVLVLAEAAREFMPSRPDLHVVYVGGEIAASGSQPMSEHIHRIVGPGLAKRVHILGHVNRETVIACMKRARVFVFPSNLEALPLVPLEAMGCGLPVVCTKYPPGPEIIVDGVNGLLADPAAPKDFSEKIARLLDNPDLAHRLAADAKEMVDRRFSLEKCAQDTVRFYEECIRQKKAE